VDRLSGSPRIRKRETARVQIGGSLARRKKDQLGLAARGPREGLVHAAVLREFRRRPPCAEEKGPALPVETGHRARFIESEDLRVGEDGNIHVPFGLLGREAACGCREREDEDGEKTSPAHCHGAAAQGPRHFTCTRASAVGWPRAENQATNSWTRSIATR